MDPDCAICHAPANVACDCESKGLEVAIKQAEARMMQSIYNDIRAWVRAHAQDYILEYFRLLTDRRKAAHNAHLERLTAHAYHYYQMPPHPNEIATAQASLKRGIDEDWQGSVQRYPEVLEYFYGLVELTLPDDNDAAVKGPPLATLNGGARKAGRRSTAPTFVGESYDKPRQNAIPPRTPPPPDRRTPGPPAMAPYMVAPPMRGFRQPPPPSSYYGGHGPRFP